MNLVHSEVSHLRLHENPGKEEDCGGAVPKCSTEQDTVGNIFAKQ